VVCEYCAGSVWFNFDEEVILEMNIKKIFILIGINVLLLSLLLFLSYILHDYQDLILLEIFLLTLALPATLLIINVRYSNNVLISLAVTLLFLLILYILNISFVGESYDSKSGDIMIVVLLTSFIISFIGSIIVFWTTIPLPEDSIDKKKFRKSRIVAVLGLILIFSIFFCCIDNFTDQYQIRKNLRSYFNLKDN
jgi:hypothetical protein